ncbi:hypothetical protein F4861DRAFT_206952 [Xylaria intraflava]|nr:hypothetical protein F4861DRAFT_206952 [Xylaria intraflava]
MSGVPNPPPHSKSRLPQPAASHAPKAPSASSQQAGLNQPELSREAREGSIRVVQPAEQGQAPTMGGNKQGGQEGQNVANATRSRSKTINQISQPHSLREHQRNASVNIVGGRGRSQDGAGSSFTNVNPAAASGSARSGSMDRGRTMGRRFELDSDEETQGLSPIMETAKKSEDGNGGDNAKDMGHAGHESNVTNLADFMQQSTGSSPPGVPQMPREQQQARGDPTSSVPQPAQARRERRRPPPLNLHDPIYVGMVNRHNSYEIEHVSIRSERAQRFGPLGPITGSSVYDDNNNGPPPTTGPSGIMNNGQTGTAIGQDFSQGVHRGPFRSPSQGSIHIHVPSPDEDLFTNNAENREGRQRQRQPVDEHSQAARPGAEARPLNYVRSRSALGIREREHGHHQRQFSEAAVPTAGELGATMSPGIGRSATMNDATGRSHRFSGVVSRPLGMDMSSPVTPLTPFIMNAIGAPAGAQGGQKTLFGEKGWLEDTAASAEKKPKAEKTNSFMESIKRKAREIVSYIFIPVSAVV